MLGLAVALGDAPEAFWEALVLTEQQADYLKSKAELAKAKQKTLAARRKG